MRGLVLGAVLGITIGVALTLVVVTLEPDSEPRTAETVETAETLLPTRANTPPDSSKIVESEPAAPSERFPVGTALLRIGDRYTFGEGRVREDDRPGWDILCQDLRSSASFACPHGGSSPRVPIVINGELPTQDQAFELLEDAPIEIGSRNVLIRVQSPQDRPDLSIGIIASNDGRVYKVRVTEANGSPFALERSVWIQYVEIPAIPGGGQIPAPQAVIGFPFDRDLLERVGDFRWIASRLPGKGFSRFLEGGFTGLGKDQIGEGPLIFEDERRIALDDRLDSPVQLKRGGGLYAPYGIGPTGRVSYEGRAGIVVEGEMAGTIVAKAYGYLYIHGDVSGLIHCESYSTVVVDGDITGTIHIDSYVTLILTGTITRESEGLVAKGSCWSDLYFKRYHGEQDLRALRGTKQFTLHVASSDLPSGQHENIAEWRHVIVADPLWDEFPL